MDPGDERPEMDAEVLLKELLIESTKIENQMFDDHGPAIVGEREDDPVFEE